MWRFCSWTIQFFVPETQKRVNRIFVLKRIMKRTLNWFVVHLSIPLLLLNACMPTQTITNRYPSWGEEILLSSPESKTQLHLRLSLPKQPIVAPACLLIVHGMNEYVGRYANIARFFSDKYIVAGIDLRGHGLTNPVLFDADRAISNGLASFDASAAFLSQCRPRSRHWLQGLPIGFG